MESRRKDPSHQGDSVDFIVVSKIAFTHGEREVSPPKRPTNATTLAVSSGVAFPRSRRCRLSVAFAGRGFLGVSNGAAIGEAGGVGGEGGTCGAALPTPRGVRRYVP